MSKASSDFQDLVAIMTRLRAPEGCPWDREQTHDSLRPYLIEEAHEVLEALESGDDVEFCEELGDLLLQVVFHAELARERGAFSIGDIVEAITGKLVRRHPHVFGDVEASTPAEVAANWARIKAEEKAAKARRKPEAPATPPSVISGIPRSLPSLIRAHRVGEKASEVGFDWNSPVGARAKITEELAEVDAAAAAGNNEKLTEEIGDLLFSVVSFARKSSIHADEALEKALEKFAVRFRSMEAVLVENGTTTHDAASEEMEAAWENVKRAEPSDRD